MRVLPAALLLGICLLGALGSRPVSAAQLPFPKYYFTDYYRHSICLRADGTYVADITTFQASGFYTIAGKQIVFHVQNQGDVIGGYDGEVIKFPVRSGYDYCRYAHILRVPAKYTGYWVAAYGDRLALDADGSYRLYSKTGVERAKGLCIFSFPRETKWVRGADGSNRMLPIGPVQTAVQLPGFGYSGSIKTKSGSAGSPPHYELSFVVYDGNTTFFTKAIPAAPAVKKRAVHKAVRKPITDDLGNTSAGDGAGIEADQEGQHGR